MATRQVRLIVFDCVFNPGEVIGDAWNGVLLERREIAAHHHVSIFAGRSLQCRAGRRVHVVRGKARLPESGRG